MGAAKVVGGQTHSGHVQGLTDPVEIITLKDVGLVAVPDPVNIGLPRAGEPGVEPGFHPLQSDGPNVCRQILAQGGQKSLVRPIGFGPEGGHLHPGVGPGVGAPGAGHLHRLLQQAGEKGLQLSLDGLLRVPLLLPPFPPGSVIAEGQTIIRHAPLPPSLWAFAALDLVFSILSDSAVYEKRQFPIFCYFYRFSPVNLCHFSRAVFSLENSS